MNTEAIDDCRSAGRANRPGPGVIMRAVGMVVVMWASQAGLTAGAAPPDASGPVRQPGSDKPGRDRSPAAYIAIIKAVGAEGAGSAQAAAAWRELAQQGVAALPEILANLDDASPRAANWLVSVLDAIVESQVAIGGSLPTQTLTEIVTETRRGEASRRAAHDLLSRIDKAQAAALVDGFADDPAPGLRRLAVAQLLDRAAAVANKAGPEAVVAYSRALYHARDTDQVNAAADALAKLGVSIDRAAQLGQIRRWYLLGPLDGPGTTGFATPYPLETALGRGAVDLKAKVEGKVGPVGWVEHTTPTADGQVHLNTALGRHKGAVAFALARVMADTAGAVEIRLGSPNAVRLWVNGAEVFAFEEYHHGSGADQYRIKARLNKGVNDLVVKVCQNEQTESWAQEWAFMVRVIDATGTVVPLKPWTDKTGTNP